MGKKNALPALRHGGHFIRQGRIKASLFCQGMLRRETIEKLCFSTIRQVVYTQAGKRHKVRFI
jgi:hypothetical protein